MLLYFISLCSGFSVKYILIIIFIVTRQICIGLMRFLINSNYSAITSPGAEIFGLQKSLSSLCVIYICTFLTLMSNFVPVPHRPREWKQCYNQNQTSIDILFWAKCGQPIMARVLELGRPGGHCAPPPIRVRITHLLYPSGPD